MRGRILCLAAAAAALLAGAAPASAATECRYLSSCESVTSPWIAVPAGTVNAPGTAAYAFPCPTGHYAAGFDWTPENVDDALLDLPPDNWAGTAPAFLLQNMDGRPGSAQIQLGCAPIPSDTRSAEPERGATVRITERRVRPDRRTRVRQRCEPGERAVESGASVLFEMRAAPERRVLRGHELEVRKRRSGVVAIVTTDEHVGDDERVVLHLYAVCV